MLKDATPDTLEQQERLVVLKGAWAARDNGFPATTGRLYGEIDPAVKPVTIKTNVAKAEKVVADIFRRPYARDLR